MKWKNIAILCLFVLMFSCIHTISFAAYASPYSEPASLIRYGSIGNGVKWVQDMLNHNGYILTVDGEFGPKTKSAVLSFQRNKNLVVDGIVGSATRSALKRGAGTTSATNTTTVINANRYTSDNVNFRSGPGTSYSSFGVLPTGTLVYVMQNRSDGWSYVKYNGRYGYLFTTYLQVTKPTVSSLTANNSTTTSSSLPTFSRTSKDLLTIIKNCKSYYANNNFTYSLANGARTIPADQSKLYNGKYCVDCSSFVTWALYEYASANGKTSMKNYFSYQRNSATFASIGANGGNDYLQVVSGGLANAKAGDILVSSGHVEFLSSYSRNANGTISLKVYNCGSNGSIKIAGVSNSATRYESEIKCILRVK